MIPIFQYVVNHLIANSIHLKVAGFEIVSYFSDVARVEIEWLASVVVFDQVVKKVSVLGC